MTCGRATVGFLGKGVSIIPSLEILKAESLPVLLASSDRLGFLYHFLSRDSLLETYYTTTRWSPSSHMATLSPSYLQKNKN